MIMNDETETIDVSSAKQEAYNMGYNRFESADEPTEGEPDISPFHESATYANHVLPQLRAMAGYADSGMGTYTQAQEVRTEDGETIESHWIFDELQEAWSQGAYDGWENKDRRTDF